MKPVICGKTHLYGGEVIRKKINRRHILRPKYVSKAGEIVATAVVRHSQ
jgi:hypothetical protein